MEWISQGTDAPRRLLVRGDKGTGKTRLCSALAAAAEAAEIEHLFLSPIPSPDEYLRLRSPTLGLAICDDIDQASTGLGEALSRTRRYAASWLVTSSGPFVPPILDAEDASTAVIVIPPFDEQEQSGADAVADFLFEERHGISLIGNIDLEAISQLRSGPWPRNGHTVAALVDRVCLLLELSGSIADGDLLRSVSIHDISGALLEVIKDERREDVVLEQTSPVIAVEGVTDKMLLEAGAAFHLAETGEDLLQGLEIIDCGGASKIPGSLITLAAAGRPAVGVFDSDGIGVEHKKAVGRVGLLAITIPLESGPLHNTKYGSEIEIEDLLPPHLLSQFYEEHPDREPETEIRHLGQLRIVPHADDKYEVSLWCSERGEYADFHKLVDLLGGLRRVLGLGASSGSKDSGAGND
jgi:hypothetical protein